MDVSGRRL